MEDDDKPVYMAHHYPKTIILSWWKVGLIVFAIFLAIFTLGVYVGKTY